MTANLHLRARRDAAGRFPDAASSWRYHAPLGADAGRTCFAGGGFNDHLATADETSKRQVEVVELPTLLTKIGSRQVLLKIDVEGAEADLLPARVMALSTVAAPFLATYYPEPMGRRYVEPMLATGFGHQGIRRRHDAEARTDCVEHILLRPR